MHSAWTVAWFSMFAHTGTWAVVLAEIHLWAGCLLCRESLPIAERMCDGIFTSGSFAGLGDLRSSMLQACAGGCLPSGASQFMNVMLAAALLGIDLLSVGPVSFPAVSQLASWNFGGRGCKCRMTIETAVAFIGPRRLSRVCFGCRGCRLFLNMFFQGILLVSISNPADKEFILQCFQLNTCCGAATVCLGSRLKPAMKTFLRTTLS